MILSVPMFALHRPCCIIRMVHLRGRSDGLGPLAGPHQNGISDEVGLIDHFDPKGGEESNVLWKSQEAAGISTPIVMGNRLFTIAREAPGTAKEAEKVVCLDATTGQKLWQNVYNVFLSDVPAERVGWSHVTGDPESDRVYVLGACCLFQCMDAETGTTLGTIAERRVWHVQHLRRPNEYAGGVRESGHHQRGHDRLGRIGSTRPSISCL